MAGGVGRRSTGATQSRPGALTCVNVAQDLTHVKIRIIVTRQEQTRRMSTKLDLAGVTEVREILGVSRQRVHQIIRDHPDFPEPVAELAVGRIWNRKEVVQWAKRTGREVNE